MNRHSSNNESSLDYCKKVGYFLSNKCVLIFFPLLLVIISCDETNKTKTALDENQKDTKVTIPDLCVNKEQIEYDYKTSTFSTNGELFSGYMVSFYHNGTLKEKIGIAYGRKQNQSSYWFTNGKLKQVATYHNGYLHGERKLWSNDSVYTLVSHLNYYLGKAHGVQKQWYKTGELYKKFNLNMGKEEGIQQAFRKNGDLYANYEARNGRIFGLKKSTLCYGLEDEKVQLTLQ